MVVGLRKAISEGQTALQEPFFFTAESNRTMQLEMEK
jgi:hypothetical protein